MKLHGEPIRGRVTKTIVWTRGDGSAYEIVVSPLPLGFGVWLREKGLVQPEVPVRVARDAQGKPLRDAQGQAVVREDRADAAHLASVERYQQRLAMLVLWRGLQGESRFVFETPTPGDEGDWLAFADRLFNELDAAGVTMAEVVWLCEAITSQAGPTSQRVLEQRADFFPAASSPSPSSG